MKCPECIKEDKKSKVFPKPGRTTCMYYPPYYDEEGQFHNHDRNTTVIHFRCSNDHKWFTSEIRGSCACGWPQKNNDNRI